MGDHVSNLDFGHDDCDCHLSPLREVGSVWTARQRRLKVEVDHGDVVIGGTHLSPDDRDYFSRIYFQACAEADAWAEATVPP